MKMSKHGTPLYQTEGGQWVSVPPREEDCGHCGGPVGDPAPEATTQEGEPVCEACYAAGEWFPQE